MAMIEHVQTNKNKQKLDSIFKSSAKTAHEYVQELESELESEEYALTYNDLILHYITILNH